MIVDSHTHLGDFPGFNVRLDAASLIDMMDENDISRSILSSLPNKLTLDAVKAHQDRLTGLVWVNPHDGDAALDLVHRAQAEWGFKGVKLHPLLDSYLPDSEIVHPVMELVSRHNMPVLFHCGHPPWSLPWHFGSLAEAFPVVPIILGHMGHGHIVYINGAIDVAMRHDNVYLETSGMPMHTKVKEAVDLVGSERVMYGSDAPFGHPAFELKKIEVSGLSCEEMENVLGGNALRLFNL